MARFLIPIGVLAACIATQASDAQPREIRTVSAISPAEKAEGAKAHPELLKEFGGLYVGPQAAYVTQVGQRIAVQSSLSSQQSDFTISLLNSSVDNAFAVPGGYVYVTRQLMALMNDEAELAGVLGHEIGHVAAQHSKKRQSAAQRNSILGAIGQVLVGAVVGDGSLGNMLQRGIGSGAQLLTLKFSRAQETEADDLGVRYLAKAGYDPAALSSMLASLAAQESLNGQASGNASAIPEWASTHPDPGARVQRALGTARATGAISTYRNRAAFIDRLEGMLYGDDPAQGMVVGRQFLHPGLKLKFTVPTGYTVDNQADAVAISSASGQAQFSMKRYAGNLDAYVQSLFDALGGGGSGRSPAITSQRTTINGLPVAFARATMTNKQGTRLSATVIAYELGPDTACHFIIATPAGQGVGAFGPMVNSLARMTDKEAAAVKPRRVHLVIVKPGDTAASLSRQMAYRDLQLERFQVLNGLAPNEALVPGSKVKLVVD